MSPPDRVAASLWFLAVVLAVGQVVLVLTGEASVPLGVASGALFLAAAGTALARRRRRPGSRR